MRESVFAWYNEYVWIHFASLNFCDAVTSGVFVCFKVWRLEGFQSFVLCGDREKNVLNRLYGKSPVEWYNVTVCLLVSI